MEIGLALLALLVAGYALVAKRLAPTRSARPSPSS